MCNRVQMLKAVLADADLPDAKRVKKIRFLVNLLPWGPVQSS